jgi:hypothetical protein
MPQNQAIKNHFEEIRAPVMLFATLIPNIPKDIKEAAISVSLFMVWWSHNEY